MKKMYSLVIAIIALALGLAIFFTNGFGVPFVRHYIGDILIIIFLFSLSGLVIEKAVVQFLLVFGLAVSVEILQLFISPGGPVQDLTIGSTFDWLDIGIYFITALVMFIVYMSQEIKYSVDSVNKISK